MVDALNKLEGHPENNFPELLKEYFQTKATETSIVEGVIQEITSTHLIIDVGLKSEGFIDIKEVENDEEIKDIKVGDKLEVFLEAYESGDGSLKLSRKRVLQEKTWQDIKAKYENDIEYKNIADVVSNAVMNCSYLPIPKNKFKLFKNFIIDFDPNFIMEK